MKKRNLDFLFYVDSSLQTPEKRRAHIYEDVGGDFVSTLCGKHKSLIGCLRPAFHGLKISISLKCVECESLASAAHIEERTI